MATATTSSEDEPGDVFTSLADTAFIRSLNNFIETELRLLNMKTSAALIDDAEYERENVTCKERFLIFKEAFNRLIGYLQVYKTILSNIQKEYDSCIALLEQKKLDRQYERSEIIKLKKKPFTIINLEARKDELQTK